MLGEDAGFEVPRGAPAPHDVIHEEDEVSELAASDPIAENLAEREDVEEARESDAVTDGPADVALRPPPDVADLFGEHLWVADKLAHAVHQRIGERVSIGVLTSAARVGLWHATRRYDPTRGVRFRFYANRRILGAILDELRAERVIPHQKASSPALSAILNACTLPTTELVGASDVAWLTSWRSHLGLRALPVARELSLAGVIAGDELLADEQLAREDLLMALRTAIGALEPREQSIVYGIYEHERTQDDILDTLNLSKSWGSRLHGEIIVRLKRAMLRAGYRELFMPGALPPLVA